jgi:MscS family membrane protein
MKLKFETLFRGLITFLALTLVWGIWQSAQSATNVTPEAAAAEPSSTTNQVTALLRGIERIDGHYLTFGLDRIETFRTINVFGEPLWKYLASAIYILLAFYISKVIDFAVLVWLKRLAARTKTELDDLLLGLLRGPLKVVVFVLFLNFGLSIFDWSGRAQLYVARALVLVVAVALTYLAIKIINSLLDIWRRRRAHEADGKFDDQLFAVLRKSINAFVIVVAVLVTAQNIGINITAAITSLSIGGLAVGLAAQDTLANLFGAVAVFADKPFRVGDTIKLDAAEGLVEEVGLRSTRVRNSDGYLVAIPNKIMGNAPITNITKRPNINTTMNLSLSPGMSSEKLQRALKILNEVYGSHPMTLQVVVRFNKFAGRRLNILINYVWKGTDYQQYLTAMQEMNLTIKERFDAESIGIG